MGEPPHCSTALGLLRWYACKHNEIWCTFLPIPLVGEGAGDTGTKSMRFGDEDADFSKSLSLYEHNHMSSHFILNYIYGTN